MFKLIRLPFKLLKLAVLVSLVAFLVMRFPDWARDIDASKVVHVVQNAVQRMIEQIEKLN